MIAALSGPILPLLLLATSLVPAALIFPLPDRAETTRRVINLLGAGIKVVLAVLLAIGVFRGVEFEARMQFLPGIELVLRADPIPVLFVFLSALLWFTTTVYAIGYLARHDHRSRFFGFFGLCVTATMGVALAGNLVTFLVFYELLTITTYPLVVHRGTSAARRAGRTYLIYTITGGAVLLVGTAWLQAIAGTTAFAGPDALQPLVADDRGALIAIFVLLIAGLGVKAALVPLHGWLPGAMAAPAPVSALLHAVAVVKAGAYGIVRVVHDLYGAPLAGELGLLTPLAVVAATTIIYGSVRALAQDGIKRRLAYSTVSQLSYIVLGASVLSLLSVTAAIAHLVHQGIMKVTLFYAAGILEHDHDITRISELDGVGRRAPATMVAFTIGAFGMVGLPPTVGFVTKFTLGTGAAEAGVWWVVVVLVASTVLNAAYFLPPVARAWFARDPTTDDTAADETTDDTAAAATTCGHATAPTATSAARTDRPTGRDAEPWLLLPTLVTAATVLVLGVVAGVPFSPLDWAGDIAEILVSEGGP